jgi:phosphoesterase RecJ-like protein
MNDDIIDKIKRAKHITVIAHVNPDADSLGGASAIYSYALMQHKKVSFFCSTKVDNRFSFLPWFDKIRDTLASSTDLAICFDCADIGRIGTEIKCDLINIDHHKSNTMFGQINIVDSSCISTTQILYNLFIENGIKINKKMATAIYAGLLEDSGSFLNDEVDGTTFVLAKSLIDLGAEHKICNYFIEKYKSLSALRLKALMLSKMQLIQDGMVAIFLVTNEDMISCGAISQECEAALEESLCLPTVKISVLLLENVDFTIKGSVRTSKDFNALLISQKFGGGGHLRRSGFNLDSSHTLTSVKEKILDYIKDMVVEKEK